MPPVGDLKGWIHWVSQMLKASELDAPKFEGDRRWVAPVGRVNSGLAAAGSQGFKRIYSLYGHPPGTGSNVLCLISSVRIEDGSDREAIIYEAQPRGFALRYEHTRVPYEP